MEIIIYDLESLFQKFNFGKFILECILYPGLFWKVCFKKYRICSKKLTL